MDAGTTAAGRDACATKAIHAFTLLELVMALGASAVILAAIYGVFSRAVHLRDDATARTRDTRVRTHAASIIRDDLRHAFISGSTTATALAFELTGTVDGVESGFPGYLSFTTTTGRDLDDTPIADVQQVEYYIVDDPEAENRQAGLLVRAVDRTLLAQTRETPPEEPLLRGVEKMEVEFYDGDAWQTSWEVSEDDTTLPEAVRVRLYPAPEVQGQTVPPIEILVPWTTQKFADP
jgi:type II secretion system protein J